MSENNPRESDLILGGQNPPPVDAAILGGLAGVKQRLASESISYDKDIRPEVDEKAKQKAMNGTFELVFNSLVARQNLKYLSVQMPRGQMSRYITTEIIDSLKNSVPYKSSEFIG